MSIYGSDKVGFFLLGGYNLVGTLTQFTDKLEAVTEETHTLGDSWREQAGVGVRHAEITQSGFYSDGANSAHEALMAGLGTSARVLCYTLEGNTTGKNFIGWEGAQQIDYTRVHTREELHKAEAVYRSNGRVEQGKILYPLTSAGTSGGNTTANGMDGTASSTAGGIGYLQITALTESTATGFAVDIMHSADNLTFTSYIGFALASGPTAERKSSTVALQRYTAVKWAGATATNPAHTFFVGLVRATATA